ncbi:MAG: OmpA family protein [Bacteroidota bacterium]
MIDKHMQVNWKYYISTLVFVFFTMQLVAQPVQYSTSSKQAIKNYEDARDFYNIRQNEKAIDALKSAIKKDTTFIEAYMLLATVYEEQKQPLEAIKAYNGSFAINPAAFPYNYFACGKLEIRACKYDDAQTHLEKYLSLSKPDAARKQEVERYIRNCKFAVEAMKKPVPFNPVNLGDGVNSKFPEYYFSFTVDQKNLIFTRQIDDKQAMFGHQEDFFRSTFSNGKWQPAVHLEPPLNTIDNEGAPSMSTDGHIVFFTACQRQGGEGSCDIYLSSYSADNKWSKPINLGAPVNTSSWESQPSFSSDGKTLYFTRRVTTKGQVNSDLFYSVFREDNTWSAPVSLGDTINTTGNEESVFIHPDNQTLYFSSNGHEGMGGLDIYISRRLENGRWGIPVNLGYPINTCGDENSLVVSADGKHAYFASNRPEGFGDLDLYVFDLYKEAQPLLTSYVKGKVTDAITSLPLSAHFEIVDIESGKTVVSNTTDKMRGEFLATLPAGKEYLLNVSKDGYLFYSENFDCRKPTDTQQAFEINVPLNKITAGASVVLKNVFFDVDKFDLKQESFSELQKLISFLNANAAVKIEIGGHTDNTGDKIKNQKLSENRAKAVLDYLISKGINAARLTSKGYGDTKPVADNKTEAGRASNRRTAFVVK